METALLRLNVISNKGEKVVYLIGAAIPSLIVSLVAVYALTVVFRRKPLHLLLLGIQSTLFGIGLFLLYHITQMGADSIVLLGAFLMIFGFVLSIAAVFRRES